MQEVIRFSACKEPLVRAWEDVWLQELAWISSWLPCSHP